MSRSVTREAAPAGVVTAPTRALGGDDATLELRGEWERVRRQRLALEKQQQRARDADGETEKGELAEDDDTEQAALVALQAPPSTDPFACCCRPFKLKKLGQSYILRERRVVERGRVTNELVLVGPHWVGVLVTLSIVLGCTALFLHQQCTLLPWYYSVITLGFCAMTLRYLYGVACKDPGIVLSETTKKKTIKPKQDDNKSHEMDDHRTTIAVDDDDNVESVSDDDALESGSMARVRGGATRQTPAPQSTQNAWAPPPSYYARFSPRARYCDICEVSQDAYTEHCDDCGVCIEDYDHHCPWMGKCIGKKNMYAFKMFNVSWVLYVIFVLFVSIQNVDWGGMAVQRLHRLSTGEWVPMGTTEKPH